MEQADREGLIDPGSLTVFITWYQFGGMEQAPTISEIANMPAALRHDLLFLMQQFGKLRRQRQRRKAKEKTP